MSVQRSRGRALANTNTCRPDGQNLIPQIDGFENRRGLPSQTGLNWVIGKDPGNVKATTMILITLHIDWSINRGC